ncbi:hypothetical protein ACLB2K_056984 [Fragaria x ananassa]
MRVLEELDLSYCCQLTDVGGQAISTIRTLKKLKLVEAIFLTERTFVAIAKNCINLEVLDLAGCRGITTTCIDAFSGQKCLRFLNLQCRSCDDLRGSAFESLALGCPSLETIVVHESLRERLLQEMQESTEICGHGGWRRASVCPDASFTGTDAGDTISPLQILCNGANESKFQELVQVACGTAILFL